ncbi:MAG: glycosyltransferase, partial [Rhodanobacter sp.]
RSAHIVIATVGSLGDLFPFLAVGQELRARGHRVTVATHAMHRQAIEQAGLDFADASGMPEPADRAEVTARAFHPWRGPRFVVHDLAALDVQASYEKLAPLCASADLLLTSTLAFAGQIVGEQLSAAGRLCWLSAVLAPMGFMSVFDPPATGMAMLDHLVGRSPARARVLAWLVDRRSHAWTAPVRRFRRRLGLPAQSSRGNPLLQGQFAAQGTLALFPTWLGAPQPDWPAHVHVCGFARYRQAAELDAALLAFLDAGPPPLVFSLGSTAVHAGETFLRESLKTTLALGQRAVLFTGSPEMRTRLPTNLPPTIHLVDYAPHAALFPRASVVVHHGGIGTSAEALHAGRPMLVVPHGFDQPDNAARLRRLGVAEVLPVARYRADRAAALLLRLQTCIDYRQRSAEYAVLLGKHAGAVVASQRLESALAQTLDSAPDIL